MGTFGTAIAKFDLQVCLLDPAASPSLETARRAFLDDFFQHASELLFYATGGKHQLGTIFLCSGPAGSAQSDALLSSSAEADSTDRRLWDLTTGPFLYPFDRLPWIAWFVHELGHYLYDLRDEYHGPGAGACSDPSDGVLYECVAAASRQTEDACLMDMFNTNMAAAWLQSDHPPTGRSAYATLADVLKQLYVPVGDAAHVNPTYPNEAGYAAGYPSQFCSAGNHSAQLHYQNACHASECCWQTLADDGAHGDLPYGLEAPAGSDKPAVAVAGPDAVTVVDTLPTETFVLLLDRSGSMGGVKMDRLHDGAAFCVDHVDQIEQLAVISFSSTSFVDSSLGTVPLDTDPDQAAWRANRVAIVTSLAAGGSTAIGGGLRAALQQIQTLSRAASQAIILFSDGLENFGAETAEQVLPDLLAAGIRVFVIGVGDDSNPLLLQELAEATGGKYLGIDPALPEDLLSSQIQTLLDVAAGIARDDTEVTTLYSAPAATPGPDTWSPPGSGGGSFTPDRIEAPVWIGKGSTRCTIGAFAPRDLSRLEFRLFDPSGAEVPASSAGVRAVRWQNGHVFWAIRDPRPGSWNLVVEGAIPEDHRLKVFGFETNPRISLDVSLPRDRVEPGKSFQIRVRLRAPLPIRATQVVARFAGSTTSIPSRPVGDVGRFGDLVAEHVLDVTVPDGARGPQTILVDVLREAGDALYPRERVCGSDRRPLDGRATRSVRVEKIVRRYVGTVIAGTPIASSAKSGASGMRRVRDFVLAPFRRLFGLTPPSREMRKGLSPARAWVHPDQEALVEAWKRKYLRT
jgi:hypothetical protein